MKPERSSPDLGTYLDEVVYPALFARLDAAFPAYGWTRKGSGAWIATHWPADFPFPVNHENADRLMVYPNRPHWVKVHGHAGVRFLDLVNGGRRPDGPDFIPAVRRLCELAAVPFPERKLSPEEAEHLRAREARRTALEAVTARAQDVLFSPQGEAARAYLADRGFTEDDLRNLGLGLYDSAVAFRAALEAGGQDLQAAEDAALLWPKLEGYVLIPWADAAGQPLTLYGRWAGKTPPDGRPKTLALPGEGTKGSPLYYDRARKAGHRDLVAVEGVFDAALLQVRGDSRVVAYVAAQFSGLQVDTLVRHKVRSVVICPDPDGGGDRGALASVAALTKAGIQAYVTPRLPDGLDPDEFLLREGLDKWKAYVERAVPGAVYHANSIIGNVSPDSPDMDRRRVVDEVLAFEATLRGREAGLDREDLLLRFLADRTGYTTGTLLELAEDFREKRRKEQAERELDRALREAKDRGDRPVLEVVRDLNAKLAALQSHADTEPPPFSVDRLEHESRVLSQGKASGWKTLDDLDVAFEPGELALLGARTGHGKTSVLIGLLLNWLSASTKDRFVFYSAEETELRIYHRLLALLTVEESRRNGPPTYAHHEWTPNEVRDFLRNPEGLSKDPSFLAAARERLRGWEDRLRVVHRPLWTVDELVAHARTQANEEQVDGILVDYLQRIPPPDGSFDRRDIEVSTVARRLKALAVDLSVPVVAGAQINRQAAEPRAKFKAGESYDHSTVRDRLRDRRPQLHHLREGGSEQEADLVLGLMNYRADYMEDVGEGASKVPDTTRLEVGTLKGRYISPGRWAGLAFEGGLQFIRDPHSSGEV